MYPHGAAIATIIVCEDDEATLDLVCITLSPTASRVLPAPTEADALGPCATPTPTSYCWTWRYPTQPAWTSE
jgi:hypothetical protein